MHVQAKPGGLQNRYRLGEKLRPTDKGMIFDKGTIHIFELLGTVTEHVSFSALDIHLQETALVSEERA